MKAINKAAKKVMDYMASLTLNSGDSVKIDNAKGTFMAVYISKLTENVYSVAHHYEQNGDLMADPDMEFLRGCDGEWYPISFRQDSNGYIEHTATLDESGNVKSFAPARQYDNAVFAGKWMRNIKEQQNLQISKKGE